jgi:hypothetical protein
MIDEFLSFGSEGWWLLFALLVFARACDLLSTYLGTPNLVLEGNPVARRLGWKGGISVSLIMAMGYATWPLLALSITTTSLLVAARNLQSAWIMRSLGEANYRLWMADRLAESPRGLPLFCFWGESFLFGIVGVGLMWFARWQLVPFGVGLGIAGYGVAVAFFTSWAYWRSGN